MQNPYIKNNNQNINQQSPIDKAINNVAKDLPFVPENFNSAAFIKGALIGAGVAYIMTNKKAQEALFKAIVKVGNLIQAGSEELKERFEDVKAEVEAEEK